MFTEKFLLADRGVVEKRTVNIPSVNAFPRSAQTVFDECLALSSAIGQWR
jgi:hypothetical protein